MSVAERTREAVRRDPSLYDALRDGVVNYSAAARSLDVDGDAESIATALRRYAEELPSRERADRRVTVRLHRGVAVDPAEFAGVSLQDEGDSTAVEATGAVDPEALESVLGRLRTADVAVHGAGVTEERLVVAVDRRAGADVLRIVEGTLEAP